MSHETPVLKQIATVDLEGVERFEASEHFGRRPGGWRGHNVNIDPVPAGVDREPFDWHYKYKVEENVPPVTLTVYSVEASYEAHPDALGLSYNAPILAELGDHPETFLAHIWQLLARQPTAEEDGLLLRSEESHNIFYVRGTDGNVLVVSPSTFEPYPGVGYWPWAMVPRPLTWEPPHVHIWREGDRVFAP